jgi:hypothetical protein
MCLQKAEDFGDMLGGLAKVGVADFSVALLPDLREDTSILEDLEQKLT